MGGAASLCRAQVKWCAWLAFEWTQAPRPQPTHSSNQTTLQPAQWREAHSRSWLHIVHQGELRSDQGDLTECNSGPCDAGSAKSEIRCRDSYREAAGERDEGEDVRTSPRKSCLSGG